MRTGVQSISWLSAGYDVVRAAREAHAAGFEGLEIAHSPSELGSPEDLARLLREHHLEFLGLTGGDFQDRLDFVRRFESLGASESRPYVYIDDWDAAISLAAERGNERLALHPHMFKYTQTAAEAEKLLEEFPRLEFLPDTAHLTIAGDDVVQVVDRSLQKYRVAAIHFKDWMPEFGRAYQSYSHGFAQLGLGDVPLQDVVNVLKLRSYKGWLVVEQDRAEDPAKSAQVSLDYLRMLMAPDRAPFHSDRSSPRLRTGLKRLPAVADCRRAGQHFLENVRQRYRLVMTCLWSLRPRDNTLVYVGGSGQGGIPLPALLDGQNAYRNPQRAVAKRHIVRDELRATGRLATSDLAFVRDLGLSSVISVPVLNSGNPHHVLFVWDLFPSMTAPPDASLLKDARRFAIGIERCLQQACARAATALQVEISKCVNREDTLEEILARVACHKAGCAAASVFMQSRKAGDLIQQAYRGRRTNANLMQLAGVAFQENREELLSSAQDVRRGTADAEGAPGADAVAIPLRDALGVPHGALVGVNAHQKHFTYEDIAILEAMGQVFSPYVQVLMTERKKLNEFDKLAHELRVPVVAFRAALERVTSECNLRDIRFSQPFLDDLDNYARVMQSLVRGLDLMRLGPRRIMLNPRLTYFVRDILAPACRFVDPLLQQRLFRRDRILRRGVAAFPRLFVDPGLLTQVVFNLLENAIKYATPDPEVFHIEIEGVENATGQCYEIAFRDWGLGVPEGWGEKIFGQGIRGPNIAEQQVMGDGLGLYLARQIVRRHGGDLIYRPRKGWTEFVIQLPFSLEKTPPSVLADEDLTL